MLIISAPATNAADVSLHLRSGERVVLSFDSRPVIVFGVDNALTFKDSSAEVTAADYSMLHKLTFSSTAGIDDVSPDVAEGSVNVSHHSVTFVSFAEGTLVRVVTLAGQLVVSDTIGPDGSLRVSLDDCPAGVYVVSAGKAAYKIILK